MPARDRTGLRTGHWHCWCWRAAAAGAARADSLRSLSKSIRLLTLYHYLSLWSSAARAGRPLRVSAAAPVTRAPRTCEFSFHHLNHMNFALPLDWSTEGCVRDHVRDTAIHNSLQLKTRHTGAAVRATPTHDGDDIHVHVHARTSTVHDHVHDHAPWTTVYRASRYCTYASSGPGCEQERSSGTPAYIVLSCINTKRSCFRSFAADAAIPFCEDEKAAAAARPVTWAGLPPIAPL